MSSAASNPATPVTVPSVRAAKVRNGADPLVMVTAYDAPGARIASEAGVDLISRVTKVKHYFDTGIKARAGIEY